MDGMEVRELLLLMCAGAVVGALGQSLRMIVGLGKAKDEAVQKGVDFRSNVFDGNRLVVSLLIGAVAGALGILTLTNFGPLPGGKISGQMFFGLLGIGYAGTDFIEGFVAKYVPGKAAPTTGGIDALDKPSASTLQASIDALPARTAAHISSFLPQLSVAPVRALSRVELSCRQNFDAGKADCNLLAKLVAADFGVVLTGDANTIVATLTSANAAANGWTFLGDGEGAGAVAAAAAERGHLVLGGRDEGPGQHGHLVIVVGGPLVRGYPRAYWGTLNDSVNDPDKSGYNKPVNWAWDAAMRDHVTYASRAV